MINENSEDHEVKVVVEYRITSVELMPEDITDLIGLNPTRSFHMGEERRVFSGNIARRMHHLWALDSSGCLEDVDNICAHLSYLRGIIEPRLSKIKFIYEFNVNSYLQFWIESKYIGLDISLNRSDMLFIQRIAMDFQVTMVSY